MRLADMGEDGITAFLEERYTTHCPRLLKAMGDDTAVMRERAERALLLTTDTLNEGVHFARDLTTPYLLGSKALAVSLSDIAAMGGEPLSYLVSLNMPPSTEGAFLKGLYRGLDKQAKKFGVSLAGGNLSRADSISITTTLLGEMPPHEALYRHGAAPGDDIYLTGFAGDSALGLMVLQEQGLSALKSGPYRSKVRKHLEPLPRIGLGRMLARQKTATATIDTSDGLLLDLGRLCRASGVGAVLRGESIPISRALREHAGDKALVTALTGGEDYELLFTARPRKAPGVEAAAKASGVLVTKIGSVVSGKKSGVSVVDCHGRKMDTRGLSPGFTHF
jgi:thiamine-monophosphate kinase